MDITDVVGLLKDVMSLLALIVGSAMALFVFFQLAPVFELRIQPRWADDTKRVLLVKFEVENKSRVRANRPEGRIQVLEHSIPPGSPLSHWVPFQQDAVIDTEQPTEWREPVTIFRRATKLYPGEKISVERLYHCPQDTVSLHIGLQVKLRQGVLGRIASGRAHPWRQTVTCFVVK